MERPAYQEDGVVDGEAFQEVGKAGLQLHVLPLHNPYAQQVS